MKNTKSAGSESGVPFKSSHYVARFLLDAWCVPDARDERYLDVKHLKIFANSLVKKMSKPKGRNDELSYLSTQVVFEYLRLRFGSQVDRLVIPSVQTGEIGTNVVLFPEASVVSAKEYNKPDEMEAAFGDKLAKDFEPEAKLDAVAGSIRFHKVLAIETKAKEYVRLSDLFMDDDVRKRLGLLFT